MNSSLLAIFSMLMALLVFAGCQSSTPVLPGGSVPPPTPSVSAAPKVGDTTQSGKVTTSGGKFYLQVGGSLKEIDSYNMNLADYVGKTVKVTGQFSGDTLFVTKVE